VQDDPRRSIAVLDSELKVNQFLLQYCRMLVGDVADERLAEQPLPGVNHPAWVLGHLTFSADRAAGLLGAEKELPAEWTTRFGPGSKPAPSRSDYPGKDELLRAVEQGFERLRRLAGAATAEQLGRPSTNPYTKDALPTVREAVAFLLTGHLGVHLGQLSAWRRMTGLPPLF
jgi:DinB superfamily